MDEIHWGKVLTEVAGGIFIGAFFVLVYAIRRLSVAALNWLRRHRDGTR